MKEDLMTLEVVDADGAIQEHMDGLSETSRSDFLKRAAVCGGSLVAGGVLMGGLASVALGARRPKANDVKILNFALTLE